MFARRRVPRAGTPRAAIVRSRAAAQPQTWRRYSTGVRPVAFLNTRAEVALRPEAGQGGDVDRSGATSPCQQRPHPRDPLARAGRRTASARWPSRNERAKWARLRPAASAMSSIVRSRSSCWSTSVAHSPQPGRRQTGAHRGIGATDAVLAQQPQRDRLAQAHDGSRRAADARLRAAPRSALAPAS